MACEDKMQDLIHKVLDEEASEAERQQLNQHMMICPDCEQHFNELKRIEDHLYQFERREAPLGFTDAVMDCLPKKKSSLTFKWLQRHPVLAAVACFALLMTGYVYSLWQDLPFQASVQGQGQVAYKGKDTVVVPRDEVIHGNLVVKNGKVKIDGKVEGNVILINSQSLSASTGHVTGHIEKVDQVLEWIWYHIKTPFQHIFLIYWTIPHGGSFFSKLELIFEKGCFLKDCCL